MFLVQPQSGQRCQYGSAAALGAAIRRGELGPHARIFHQATQRWLPISVHPEYRKVELAREEAYGKRWRDRQWTFLAERPAQEEEDLIGTFRPIPDRPASTMVLIPAAGQRSWVRTLGRLLGLA